MAQNYNKSDYARNKYSKGIVYSSVTGAYEITEEQYLSENSDKTPEDFAVLKRLSDASYLETLNADTTQGRLVAASVDDVKESEMECEESVESEYIRREEHKAAPTITDAMDLLNACLSETQKRRYMMMFFQNLTEPEIAELEGVNQSSVSRSLVSAQNRIEKAKKKYFGKFS